MITSSWHVPEKSPTISTQVVSDYGRMRSSRGGRLETDRMATLIEQQNEQTQLRYFELMMKWEGRSDRQIRCRMPMLDYTARGRAYIVECGRTQGGYEQLCDACEHAARKRYPQGWRYYAGDMCRHGAYVGGSGIDWMCGACESGED